jgi:hypothetical protein
LEIEIAVVATSSDANEVFRELGQLLASLTERSTGHPIPWSAQLDGDARLSTRKDRMLLAMLKQAKGDIPAGLLP